MHAVISTRRIVSIFCLLLTLVISLFISNYYFADEVVVEGLTGGDNTDAASEAKAAAKEAKTAATEAKKSAAEAKKFATEAKKASATESSMTSSPSTSVGSSNTGITESFELQYSPVSTETHISTTHDKQPHMPSRNNALGVFNHTFGMSNPNEQFVIPRI
jgi:hypothetical protein